MKWKILFLFCNIGYLNDRHINNVRFHTPVLVQFSYPIKGPHQEHSNKRVKKHILFKLIVKVPVVGNTADTPNPPGLLPFFKKEIWESPRAKENLAPVGFEPTTSGLDLPVYRQ